MINNLGIPITINTRHLIKLANFYSLELLWINILGLKINILNFFKIKCKFDEQSFKDIDWKSWRTKNLSKRNSFQHKYYINIKITLYISTVCKETCIFNPNTLDPRQIKCSTNASFRAFLRNSRNSRDDACREIPRSCSAIKQRIMKSVTPLGCSHIAVSARTHAFLYPPRGERETLRAHVYPMSLIFQGYRTARRRAAGSVHFARTMRAFASPQCSGNAREISIVHRWSVTSQL